MLSIREIVKKIGKASIFLEGQTVNPAPLRAKLTGYSIEQKGISNRMLMALG